MKKPKIEEPKVAVDGLRVSTYMLGVGAAVLFGFSIFMWNKFIYTSDTRVFWDAVAHALSTEGVEIINDDSEPALTRRITTKLDLMGDLSAETRSEFKDANTDSIIRTVSTKTEDYLYYEKNDNKTKPELKQFEGTWVDISTEGQTESKTLADHLTNGSLIFMANLSSSDRRQLVELMRKEQAFAITDTALTRQIDGRDVRVYTIKIQSVGFNKALKKYFELVGLTEAAEQTVDVSAQNLEPEVEMAVDPARRQFVAIGYPTLDAYGARTYKNWDSKFEFELPTSSVSAQELQTKLDTIYTPTTN